MFCTGAQPVGGGVGAGWRGRRGGEAVGPVQSSSGKLLFWVRHGDHYSTGTIFIYEPGHILLRNQYIFYLGTGTFLFMD